MSRLRWICPATGLALLVLAVPAPGQTRADPRAAEAVVRQAFQALGAMRWDSVAALVHPEALRRFHLAQLEHHRLRERYESRAADERHPVEMPEEVRTWLDEQQQRHQAQYPSGLAAEFAGISSLAELEALPPEEAFARWVEAHDARSLLMRRPQAVGQPIPPEIMLGELHPENRVVGSVVEDDSTIHVLYRTGLPGEEAADDELDQLAIATMRPSVEGWRIWTTRRDPQLFGMQNWVVSIELPEERVERLREAAERTFTWPEEGPLRVRASVEGYTPNARTPETIRVEVVRPDGSTAWIELPHEALIPLWNYLQPWLYPPDR